MDSKRIGQFISMQRKQMSMTQKDLASKLNITNKAISKWETGEGYPDISVLPTLAEILNVTVDELLKGEKNSSQKHSGNINYVKENKQQVNFIFENSMKRFLNHYQICLGIILFGIVSSFLSFKLYNGTILTLGYVLIVSMFFLIIEMMFYINICNNVKGIYKKSNSMLEDVKLDYNKFIYKKHLLFYAAYLIQITICICAIPLYYFASIGYYRAFHALYGYNSNGRFIIDFYFCIVLCLVVYCILFITGTLIIKKKFDK